MERMDEVLARWGSDLGAFPEDLGAREETGCCFSPILADPETVAGPHDPETGEPL